MSLFKCWRVYLVFNKPVGIVVKDIAVGIGGLRFDSLAGQIAHSVANGWPPLRPVFGILLHDAKPMR